MLTTKGFSTETGFTQIGFLIDDLSASQISYLSIHNTNEWLKNNFGLDIAVFCQFFGNIPCLTPSFARFHVRDISAYFGNLIATTLDNAKLLTNAPRTKKFYYINYPDWNLYDKEDLDLIYNDRSIIKFARSEDYLRKIRELGYDISNIVVEDFNIDKICEVLNGDKQRND